MQRWSIKVSIMAAMALAAGVGIWSYSHGTREPMTESAPTIAAPKPTLAQNTVPANSSASSNDVTSAPPTNNIEQLIGDATGSSDPNVRSAAIAALATAPKERVLPVLQSLANGGDIADRHRALKSLSTIAIQQGDSDGLVRDVIRQVIYHSEDETTVQNAQMALDEVEMALASSAVTVHRDR